MRMFVCVCVCVHVRVRARASGVSLRLRRKHFYSFLGRSCVRACVCLCLCLCVCARACLGGLAEGQVEVYEAADGQELPHLLHDPLLVHLPHHPLLRCQRQVTAQAFTASKRLGGYGK